MSDRQLRRLRAAARRSRRKLEAHDAPAQDGPARGADAASGPRDRALEHDADLSRAWVLAARARRRLHR